MGTGLINRSTRKLSLTEDGRDFYLRCSQILADLEEAESSIKDSSGALQGRIRVAAPLTFSILHLNEILTAFMQDHPGVSIELDLNDRRVDVISEGFDLAIRIGRLQDSALIAKRLTKIRHYPVASPNFLERFGRPDQPEALSQYPILTYRSERQSAKWDFERPDGSQGSVSVSGVFQCNNGDALTMAAANGLGVCLEPTFITSRFVADGRLVPLFVDHTWSDNAAFAVFSGNKPLPRRVRSLIDFIAERLAPEPVWDEVFQP
jgi:DNA-binding transcriptional LysR family regulator